MCLSYNWFYVRNIKCIVFISQQNIFSLTNFKDFNINFLIIYILFHRCENVSFVKSMVLYPSVPSSCQCHLARLNKTSDGHTIKYNIICYERNVILYLECIIKYEFISAILRRFQERFRCPPFMENIEEQEENFNQTIAYFRYK